MDCFESRKKLGSAELRVFVLENQAQQMKESLRKGLKNEGYLQDMITKSQDEAERLRNLVKSLRDCIDKDQQLVKTLQQQVVTLQQQIVKAHERDEVYRQQVVDAQKQAAGFQQQAKEYNSRYTSLCLQYATLRKEHESSSNEHQSLLREFTQCEHDKITFYNQAHHLSNGIQEILSHQCSPHKQATPYGYYDYNGKRLDFAKEQITKGKTNVIRWLPTLAVEQARYRLDEEKDRKGQEDAKRQ